MWVRVIGEKGSVRNTDGFYTMKGYALQETGQVSSAMEDYLEMITRITNGQARVRVHDVASLLHVKASSATKMVQQLTQSGYVHAEKYGKIELTPEGREYGEYLLYRHDVLQRFLCFVNRTEDELEQVEKIEHFLDRRTIENIASLLDGLIAKE